MVTTKFEDGNVTLYLDGELKRKEATVESVTIGTIVEYDYETWEEILSPAVYDTAYVGKDATLSGATVSADGFVFADDGGRFGGILINGGTFSGSGLCENVLGMGFHPESYSGYNYNGAGICLTSSDYTQSGAGAVYLTGSTFSGCAVCPANGFSEHGGAVETYGGTLSATNSLFVGNRADGTVYLEPNAEEGTPEGEETEETPSFIPGASGGAMALIMSTNTITGSTFSGNSAYFGGAIQQNSGSMTVTGTLFIGNSAVGKPNENDSFTTENGGGAIEIHSGYYAATATITGSTFSENTARRGGAIYNDTYNSLVSEASVSGSTFSGNTAEVEGGAIYNYAVLSVSDSVFGGNEAGTGTEGEMTFGGAISNAADGTMTVSGSTFSGNSASAGGAIWNGGSMTLESIVLETASDTVFNSGSLAFAGENKLGAGIINNGQITFAVSGAAAVVDALGQFCGTGSYLLSIAEDAAIAGALFAASAGTFSGSLSVKLGDTALSDAFTLTGGIVGNDLALAGGDKALRLLENKGALTVKQETLEKLVPAVSNDGSVIAWTDGAYAGKYWVEIVQGDSFDGAIRIATGGSAFDVAGRAGDYSCRAAEEEGSFTAGSASWSSGKKEPRQVVSNGNGRSDIFFASVDEKDVWSAAYYAKNTVTGKTAAITGRNRIRDTFSGSESDANILYLSDTDNGDALFMDDVYSEFGDAARLSLIREVRAGAGDDVVDMTGEHYTAQLAGMAVRGGAGDDVLWGAAGGNKLFGDAGNDCIAGGAGDDVIAGGAGDDVLAGGGGNDTFAFGENWGNDVVSQSAGGTVTLWFASGDNSKWDSGSLTYTDGDNSVTVSDVSADRITLKFGDDCSAQYKDLAAAGAFLGSSSEAVFETEAARTQGILASL